PGPGRGGAAGRPGPGPGGSAGGGGRPGGRPAAPVADLRGSAHRRLPRVGHHAGRRVLRAGRVGRGAGSVRGGPASEVLVLGHHAGRRVCGCSPGRRGLRGGRRARRVRGGRGWLVGGGGGRVGAVGVERAAVGRVVEPGGVAVDDDADAQAAGALPERLAVETALRQVVGRGPVAGQGLLDAGQQRPGVGGPGGRGVGGGRVLGDGEQAAAVDPGRPAVGAQHVPPVTAGLGQLHGQQRVEVGGGPGGVGLLPGGHAVPRHDVGGAEGGHGHRRDYRRSTTGSWRRSSRETPNANSADSITSIPTSSSQTPTECRMIGSEVRSPGDILARSTVPAIAPSAQREGTSQESCSRPGTPSSSSSAPQNTTWTMASSTSSGIVTSSLRTSADTRRPRVMAVKASSATATVISTSGGMRTPSPPGALRSTPRRATRVRTTAWRTVTVPRTTILESR